MKKLVFKGVINGKEFNSIESYNKEIQRLIESGEPCEANTETTLVDVNEAPEGMPTPSHENKNNEIPQGQEVEIAMYPFFWPIIHTDYFKDNEFDRFDVAKFFNSLRSICIRRKEDQKVFLNRIIAEHSAYVDEVINSLSEADLKEYMKNVEWILKFITSIEKVYSKYYDEDNSTLNHLLIIKGHFDDINNSIIKLDEPFSKLDPDEPYVYKMTTNIKKLGNLVNRDIAKDLKGFTAKYEKMTNQLLFSINMSKGMFKLYEDLKRKINKKINELGPEDENAVTPNSNNIPDLPYDEMDWRKCLRKIQKDIFGE